jgi:hypothetical protein
VSESVGQAWRTAVGVRAGGKRRRAVESRCVYPPVVSVWHARHVTLVSSGFPRSAPFPRLSRRFPAQPSLRAPDALEWPLRRVLRGVAQARTTGLHRRYPSLVVRLPRARVRWSGPRNSNLRALAPSLRGDLARPGSGVEIAQVGERDSARAWRPRGRTCWVDGVGWCRVSVVWWSSRSWGWVSSGRRRGLAELQNKARSQWALSLGRFPSRSRIPGVDAS